MKPPAIRHLKAADGPTGAKPKSEQPDPFSTKLCPATLHPGPVPGSTVPQIRGL